MAGVENEKSRREFLMWALAIGLGGFVAVSVAQGRKENKSRDPVFRINFDENKELSFDEMEDLAIRLDYVYDKLPPIDIPPTEESLHKLGLELIPQYEYEGFTEMAQWPKTVGFVFFRDGTSANHVWGRSDCSTYAILNGRIALNTSSFYGREMVFTLAHELAHVAQTPAVCAGPIDLVENSAQIAALEVCAGLANQGNKIFFTAFVEELRGMAISSAYFVALKEGNLEKFENLRKRLSPSAFAEARYEKSRRRWDANPARLLQILEWYNYMPMTMIVDSIRNKDSYLGGLALPVKWSDSVTGEVFLPPKPRVVRLDDTKYLLENLERLAKEVK